jgi:hypothetical protein
MEVISSLLDNFKSKGKRVLSEEPYCKTLDLTVNLDILVVIKTS